MFDFDADALKKQKEESLKNPFRNVQFNSMEELQEQLAQSYDDYIFEREFRSLKEFANQVRFLGLIYIMLGLADSKVNKLDDKQVSQIFLNLARINTILVKVKTLQDVEEAFTKLGNIVAENAFICPEQGASFSIFSIYAEVMDRMNMQSTYDLSRPELQDEIDRIYAEVNQEINQYFYDAFYDTMKSSPQADQFSEKLDKLFDKLLKKHKNKNAGKGGAWDDSDLFEEDQKTNKENSSDEWRDLL